MFFTILAVATALGWIFVVVDAARGAGKTTRLNEVDVGARDEWPTASIVVAARNEERGIEAGVRSLLAQEYPGAEVIVIDDRSTDRTGAILSEIAATEPRLRVVSITSLPPHWLGKNHALHLGADAARGEFILFTDADVVLEPDALRKAVAYMEGHHIDHLACSPHMTGGTFAVRMFVAAFSLFFGLYARPWKARDPKSRAHIGVGAFNLIRAAAYRAVQGHSRIAMRPDDDIKLGKLIKLGGFRQEFLSGEKSVKVEWYATLPAAIDGLMKNAFSGVDYSWPMLIGGSILLFVGSIWPFIAIFVLNGTAVLENIVAATIIVLIAAVFSWRSGLSPLFGLTYPISSLIFLYILWKAAIRTQREGGIRWRETLYPLAELRANKV